MDESAKRNALRMVPYGLYVVGARDRDVRDHASGINAFIGSWVTQTSFKPPMLVVAIKGDARSNRMIRDSGVFTLSVLGTGQKPLAQSFFKDLAIEQKSAEEGTMSGVPYRIEPRTGCPIFPDAPAWVACEVVAALDPLAPDARPDHTPFLARVVEAGYRGPEKPLAREETGWVYAG